MLVAMSPLASAQAPADPLRAAVEKAVLSNPEVGARFHAYQSSLGAIDVARAAYRPRVDLNANIGRDQDRIEGRAPETQSMNRHGASLALTQLLWDGLGTRRDVERTSHESLARYFEFVDATEQVALEAARAFVDVQRFRRLVQLAEDNYVQHKYASLQIQSRFRAGVGRGVDLEQANARLALAESNLHTEVANLHDVVARYQRIVGEPPSQAPAPVPAALARNLPASADQAVGLALQRNAAISASVENMRASRSLVQLRQAGYQPRVEARVRSGGGNHFEGVRDQRRDSTAELVLNWNLYNGGADQARVRQQVGLLNQAEEQRDRACRDVRQTAAIAYNDTRKLADQLVLLDRNALAIEKAREAYRQQFDIGQRSLLDLLNAENELYTARRAHANAQYDIAVSQLRTLAVTQQLTGELGIRRPEAAPQAAASWAAEGDAPLRCPAVVTALAPIPRDELDARAQRMQSAAPAASAPVRRP